MRQEIIDEIAGEREYQEKKWGNKLDDAVNTPWMWVAYIAQYSTKWMLGKFAPLPKVDVDMFRIMMIKTATICVAAVESIDRQRADKGRCFFELPE